MGSRILYYLLIKPLSLCPYWFLYGVSDFFFVILFYLVGYRKKVVMDNLEKCFPAKTRAELKTIQRKFYRHFCDLVIETLKNFSISEKQARSRMLQENAELIDAQVAKHGGVILTTGHFGNWELWAVATPYEIKTPILGIYKRLSNAFFDARMRESRSKSGLLLVATRETGNYLREHQDEPKAVAFGFDQSPANPEKCVWIQFMNRDTAAYFGAEKYAKDFNYPVIFGVIYRQKRGHYKANYSLLCEHPSTFPHGEITQKLHQELERHIRICPELYLWSHKRWKHKRPASM